MFDKNFYPTPINVIEMMNFDSENKIVLEPSAGKGDLIDYLHTHNAKEVCSFEINKDLAKIVQSKSNFLGFDFLKSTDEQLSHVQLIVMNPPFDTAEKHILHAWNVAPEGCEIYSLCNWETINKDYNYRELNAKIRDYGNTENLGNCFSTAERKTNVEVGLVKLFKPVLSQNADYTGFYLDEDEEQDGEGIMSYNEVRAIVNRYVGSMKAFDKMFEEIKVVNGLTAGIGISAVKLEIGYDNAIGSKEDFAKMMQIKSWEFVFAKLKIEKYVTQGVMRDINRFVHNQSKIPFTMKNIYKMLEIIVGTSGENFNKAVVEVIDNFTRHTHENRYNVEGWKTNESHFLGKKFIVNYFEYTQNWNKNTGRFSSYGKNILEITDLEKVLCNLLGKDYAQIKNIVTVVHNLDNALTNTWYDSEFFKWKGFKKNTGHFIFKDDKHWELLNRKYGEIKGFALPEQDKKSEAKETKTREKTEKKQQESKTATDYNFDKVNDLFAINELFN